MLKISSSKGGILSEMAIVLVVLMFILMGTANIWSILAGKGHLSEAVAVAARAGAREPTVPVSTALSAFYDCLSGVGVNPSNYRCNVRIHQRTLNSGMAVSVIEVSASRIGQSVCAKSSFVIESGEIEDDHVVQDSICFPGE